MKRVTVLDMAITINESCSKGEYFWACGLVKETVRFWRYETACALLCEEGRQMAEYYEAEGRE